MSECVSNSLRNFLFIIVSQFVSGILQLPAIPQKLSVFSLLPDVSNVFYKLLLFLQFIFPSEKKAEDKKSTSQPLIAHSSRDTHTAVRPTQLGTPC